MSFSADHSDIKVDRDDNSDDDADDDVDCDDNFDNEADDDVDRDDNFDVDADDDVDRDDNSDDNAHDDVAFGRRFRYDDDEEFPPKVPPEQFIQFDIRNNKEAPLEENIQMLEIRITVQKPPLNGSDFVAVLDVSDSMEGDKLGQMKEAMLHLIQQLTPVDRLSIVQFNADKGERVCPLWPVTDSYRPELEDLVKGLQTKKSKYKYNEEELDQALSLGCHILEECTFRRSWEDQRMILMSGKHHDGNMYGGRSIYSYWFRDGQNAKDWSHAAADCLNEFRIVDKIRGQTLTITEIKDESTILKVSYDGGQQSLGRDGSTTIEIDHDSDRYNHRILVELLLCSTNNKKRVADVLACSYRYRYGYGYNRFQKSFKINTCRMGEVEVGQLEAPPEKMRVEDFCLLQLFSDDQDDKPDSGGGQISMIYDDSGDGQISKIYDDQLWRIDGDQFWRINDDQVVFVPPNSMPCFPKPEPPIIRGRVQAVVRYNDKVTTAANRQKVMLELTGEEKVSRSPADIVAVLDVSRSMAGEKLAEMKRAMLFLITKLSPVDRLSIITYSSEAEMLYPLRPVTLRHKTELENLINRMQAHGGTNGRYGLSWGMEVLESRKCKKGRHGAIMFLAGSRCRDIYLSEAAAPVHTFGFGDDIGDDDEWELYQVARLSGGTYSDVRLGNLCVAFAQCLAHLLTVVAHHLTIFTRHQTDGSWSEPKILGDLCMKECHKVLLDGIPLDEGKSNTEILHFFYSYEFDGQEYESDDSIVTVSRVGEVSAEDVVTEEMVLYAVESVDRDLRAKGQTFSEELEDMLLYAFEFSDISKEEMEGRVREYLASELMRAPPEVLAEEMLQEIRFLIHELIFGTYGMKWIESTVVKCMKKVRYCGKVLQRDVELWDDLWADLEELHESINSRDDILQKEGHAFAYSLLSSLNERRHASRGHNIGRFKLFATPLMQQFLQEALDFEAN